MTIKILQEQCNPEADYSGTDVPVIVAVAPGTITDPGPGELQTFCYTVTQVSEPFGLSHWLLGICPTITLDDIVNISVFIDDEEQTVIPGENVEIRTEENPDPPTGCVGLKFDFGLEEGQVMTVCFSLLTPHQVGPVNVCINGGQVTETGMTICGPICGTIEECDTVVEQEIGICVPVTVTPHVHVGAIDVTCCGEAQVSQTEDCSVTDVPVLASCTFFVRQNLCVHVPIRFSAMGEPGPHVVTCGSYLLLYGMFQKNFDAYPY